MTMISTRLLDTQVSRTAPHFGPAPRIEREQCSTRASSRKMVAAIEATGDFRVLRRLTLDDVPDVE